MTEIDNMREHSDFSGEFTEDGVVVYIDIYRAAGSDDGWALEVVDDQGVSTIWEGTFPTDRAAYEEFLATIQRDGIESFSDAPSSYLH